MLFAANKIAAWISLLSNVFLTSIKIIVGVLFNSQVLIADGVHNAADVIASLVTLGSLRVSSLPADEDHPYGHGKAEVIASGMIGLILLIAALLISYKSIETIMAPAPKTHWIGLFAAVISLVWKQGLFIYTMKVGKQVHSKSLVATAYDHLADVYASLAAVIGIGIAMIGDHFNLNWAKYGDPIAGIIVSIIILKLSIEMLKDSAGILMEKNVESEKINQYKDTVMKISNVKRLDSIRGREHGNYTLVDIRVSVPASLTVEEGHDISVLIRKSIMETDPMVREVFVHINPWYKN